MFKNVFTRSTKNRRIKKWGAIIAAAVIVVAVVSYNNAAQVRIATVKLGSMQEVVELQGKVELENKEKVFSRLSGFVDEINASEGDFVNASSKLLQLSVDDLNFAISKAEAAYNASKAELSSVKKSIKPEQVKVAEAELKKAEAMAEFALQGYNTAKEDYNNAKTLYAGNAIAEKDLKNAELALTEAESTYKDAEQTVSIARYNLDILSEGVSGDAIGAAEANAMSAKAGLDELISNKGKASIYAHTGGTVLAKNIEKGEAVQPGSLLYEIGDYDSAYIKVDVLVDDISKIKIGQNVIISGDAIDDRKIQGKVYYIAPRAESRVSSLGVEQQRIEVRIRFDNHLLKLKPGYALDTDIITTEKPSTIYVPDKAVFELDGIDSVFVVRNNRLELREVKCGIENDDYIEVTSGLSQGERVVVDPSSELEPGEKVKYQK